MRSHCLLGDITPSCAVTLSVLSGADRSCCPVLCGDVVRFVRQAYDNRESSVRKAAVFCIVTAHSVCGGAVVEPHLASLNATKMKLLRMYISRAQGVGSPAESPRSADSPAESPRDSESPPQ